MFGRKVFGAVSLATLAILGAPAPHAVAQLISTDPSNSVLIDLGAIDSALGAAPSGTSGIAPGANAYGRLLLPPQNVPSSRLLGPDGRPIPVPRLRAPQAEAAPELTAPRPTVTRQAAAPKPAKRPAETQTAARRNEPTPAPKIAPAPKAAPPAPTRSGNIAAERAEPEDTDDKAKPAPASPMALNATPTPPPAVMPAPPPAMASAEAPKAAAPKTGSPTPPPVVVAPKPADTPSPPPAAGPKSLAPTEQAALPPQTQAPSPKAPATPDSLEIRFAVGAADLSDDAKAKLDALSESLKGNEKSRLQLLAYASEDQISPSKARRLSLSRALAVRSHLINKGIRSTRIDVRALGDQVPGGDPNRVDLKVSDR